MIRTIRKPVTGMATKLIEHGAWKSLEVDDLMNVAFAAVWKTRERFDPSRSSFQTYAMLRARGAMLDELRKLDHVPRQARRRAKLAGVELPKVESIEHDFTIILRPDKRTTLPVEGAAASDFWRGVRRLLEPRAAEVLERYYRRDYTLKEIGRQLGLSESRVCQLHTLAVQRLKKRGEGLA